MHVVAAAHDFYPDPGSGGTGRYVYETSRRLVDRGHRVSVITRRRGDRPVRSVVDGISVYRYPLEVADRPAPAVWSQLPRASRAVGEHLDELTSSGPLDLLSVQGPVTALLVDRQLDIDVPRIATFHSPWPVEYRLRTRDTRSSIRREFNTRLRWRLERHLLARMDGVVTLSQFMRDVLRRVYGPDVDPVVIPGGVDVGRFSPAAADDPSLDGSPSFLTVRRLAERMGHPLLLEAFATVVERHPDARLYIAGDGPRRAELERLAVSLDIADQTAFLGYVPDADLPSLYAAADVFVLPSTELEGFGLATLEALASGTVVVATPVGGTVEVLAGLADHPEIPEAPLVSAVSADALAERMLAWCAHPPDAIDAAGQAGRGYVQQEYPWSRTVDQLAAIYDRTAGRGPTTVSTSHSRNAGTSDWVARR